MKFFNTAEIGTSDVVLYEVPATLEASIPILFFHNKTGSAVDLTLKVYDHSNVSTGTIWPEQIAADEKFVFSKALLLNEGDKLIASASVDASIDATLCGISSMAVPISGPLNPLGDWNSVTDYVVRDLAFDDDTSWICVTPNTNSEPSLVNADWMVLAKKGAAGVAGFEADGSIKATGPFDMDGHGIELISSLNGGQLGGEREALMNGGHEVYQRGSVSILAGNSAYTLDRYLVTNDTDQTVIVTREDQDPGIVSIPGSPRFKMRLNFAVAASSGVVRVAQRCGDVYGFSGLISVSARAYLTGPAVAETLACEVVQSFGTGGSPSADVTTVAASLDIATVYDASEMTRKAQFSIPSISTKILGTDNNDYIELAWVLTPRNSGNYEICRQSFVEGDATAETDPASVRLNELPLCQEYYYQHDGNIFGSTHSGSNQMCVFPYPVTMKNNPALTYTVGAGSFVANYSTKDEAIIYLLGAGSVINMLKASADL